MTPASRSGKTQRTAPARWVIGVGSGKGGVGKSTVSLNLALALAADGARVGLLDADLYGPDIPLMVGLTRSVWGEEWTMARRAPNRGAALREPIERHGLAIMSAGFLIAEDQPLVLEAGAMRFLMTQMVWEVDWGQPDYLIIDLPPGTADIQQLLLKEVPFAGALLVVNPQDVAHLDGKKAVQQYRRANVPLLGAVENMSGFLCPHCGVESPLFAPVSEARSIWSMGVDRLGTTPVDPLISQMGDGGLPLLLARPASVATTAFRDIARQVRERLGERHT